MDSLVGPFLFAAVIFLVATVWAARKHFSGNMKATTGTIVDIKKPPERDRKGLYKVKLRYKALDGTTYTSKNRLSVARTYEMGDMVKLKYSVADPEMIAPPTAVRFYGFVIATAVCGLTALVFHFTGL